MLRSALISDRPVRVQCSQIDARVHCCPVSLPVSLSSSVIKLFCDIISSVVGNRPFQIRLCKKKKNSKKLYILLHHYHIADLQCLQEQKQVKKTAGFLE